MYEKPTLRKFGTFRELTKLGLNQSTDGGSIFGITSPGSDCQSGVWGATWEAGCVNGPQTS